MQRSDHDGERLERSPAAFLASVKAARARQLEGETFVKRFTGNWTPDKAFTAPKRLRCVAAYFRCDDFLIKQTYADWRNVHPDLQCFAAGYLEYARRKKVPLYVHKASQRGLLIFHAKCENLLSQTEVQYLRKFGSYVAEKQGRGITPGEQPGSWFLPSSANCSPEQLGLPPVVKTGRMLLKQWQGLV